jgi:hypothetical protein
MVFLSKICLLQNMWFHSYRNQIVLSDVNVQKNQQHLLSQNIVKIHVDTHAHILLVREKALPSYK